MNPRPLPCKGSALPLSYTPIYERCYHTTMLIDCHTHIYPDDAAEKVIFGIEGFYGSDFPFSDHAAELKAVNRIFGAYACRILTDNPVRLLAL